MKLPNFTTLNEEVLAAVVNGAVTIISGYIQKGIPIKMESAEYFLYFKEKSHQEVSDMFRGFFPMMEVNENDIQKIAGIVVLVATTNTEAGICDSPENSPEEELTLVPGSIPESTWSSAPNNPSTTPENGS